MSCGLEYCTRSCGCANCVYNTSRTIHVVTPEEERRNKEIVANFRAAEKERHTHFINEILPHTIVPLLDDNDGCGFFVKGYFFTAGHCLDAGYIHFKYNDKDYRFTKDDAVYFETIDTKSKGIQTRDIAIFKFEEATHYLNIGNDLNILDFISDSSDFNFIQPDLSDLILPESSELILPHYIHKVERCRESKSVFNTPKESYVLIIDKFQYIDSILEKIEGENHYVSYMFEASTDASIRGGSSGSPLINSDHNVVGLLIGCRDFNNKPNIILFNHLEWCVHMFGLY